VTRSARPSWKRWALVLLTVTVAPAHTQELTPAQREWFHGNAIVFDSGVPPSAETLKSP
jgi:hypothetical protein